MRTSILLLLSIISILTSCDSSNNFEKTDSKKNIERNQFFINKRWTLKYYSFYKKSNNGDYVMVSKSKLDSNKFVIRFDSNSNYTINSKPIGKWNSQKRRLELMDGRYDIKHFKGIPFDFGGVYIIDFGFRNRLKLVHHILNKKNDPSSYYTYDFYEERTDSVKDIDIQL